MACFFCQKYVSILVAFLGMIPYYLLAVPLYVAANGNAVFVFRGSIFSSTIEQVLSENLNRIELIKLRQGLLNDKVLLRRDGRDLYKLRVARSFRNEVNALSELLRANAG